MMKQSEELVSTKHLPLLWEQKPQWWLQLVLIVLCIGIKMQNQEGTPSLNKNQPWFHLRRVHRKLLLYTEFLQRLLLLQQLKGHSGLPECFESSILHKREGLQMKIPWQIRLFSGIWILNVKRENELLGF